MRTRIGAGPWVPVMLSALPVLCGLTATARASETQVAELSFATSFLRTGPGETVDVARFSRANHVTAGVYSLDGWLNGRRMERVDVRFVGGDDKVSATPCLSRDMLERFGVDFSKVGAGRGIDDDNDGVPPAPDDSGGEGDAENAGAALDAGSAAMPSATDRVDAADPGACVDLASELPDATIDFDFGLQSFALSVPQMYVRRSARGYVSPERWDYGLNAGFLNYNASTYHTNVEGGRSSTSGYLGLNAGANIGGWRLRTRSSLTTASGRDASYNNIATYLQHDVQSLRSQATIGDTYTSGEIFDSVSFRGVQLATDDRMLPQSQRGYAPVVRGTAQTNAQVMIRQNGQIIYETRVSPGPFEIDDLYPTGAGGNLEVQVREADGRSSSFVVPYASVPQSLRPGATRFAATAGRLRNDALDKPPTFAQFTLQRGLTNAVTAYGGAMASDGYAALNLGGALTTGYGAFAADVTASTAQVPHQGDWHGTSVRASYNKLFASTDTNFAVAAYRYSAPSYLGFSDAAALRELALNHGDTDNVARHRGRLQLSLSQRLGRYGSVYLSASAQQYWNREQADNFFQAGYSNSFGWGSYSITAGRTRNGNGEMDTQIALNVSIPLGAGVNTPRLSSTFTHSDGATDAQASVSGTLGDDHQFGYNAYGTYTHDEANSIRSSSSGNAGVSGSYRSTYGQLSASASAGSHTRQVSASVAGGVVVHAGGVTLSQPLGNTFGIVHAPGAQGASVTSATGVEIDGAGYAVVPYLTPYALNTVSIDPKGISADVEFTSTSEEAVPRAGAIALLRYDTVTGRAALIRAPRAGGEALPFGADVLDADGLKVGVVAQGSRIFARGIDDLGVLTVTWSDGADGQCQVDYRLPPVTAETSASYASVDAVCAPADATLTTPSDGPGQPTTRHSLRDVTPAYAAASRQNEKENVQ